MLIETLLVLAVAAQEYVPKQTDRPAVIQGDGTTDYDGSGLNIISTQMHVAIALARRAGVEIDQNAYQRSFRHLLESINTSGGVCQACSGGKWVSATGCHECTMGCNDCGMMGKMKGKKPGPCHHGGGHTDPHEH